MSNGHLIFIVGPTGVGKTNVAFALAQKAAGEIISCDAMQVYREVNIACDKPSLEMRQAVKHHVVDVVSVNEEFNAARFRSMALDAIADIHQRQHTPIVCGGSGMYMAILLDGIFEENAKDEDVRRGLQKEIAAKGSLVLHKRLSEVDPQAAAKIHPNNAQRIVRALEVITILGRPLSEMQQQRRGIWGQTPIRIFGLNRPREELYARADARVERMFERGLVEEVRTLRAMDLSRTAAAIIGIPEVSGYLNNGYDLERAKYLMKRNTRHYVKRQLTWFRRDERIQWIDIEAHQGVDNIAEIIKKEI